MTLITVSGCEPCKEVKKVIEEQDINIDIVEIKKKNGKYIYDGYEIPDYTGFPILYFGLDGAKKPNYLVGKEGIISFLTKGYVYESDGKMCPYLKKNCIEKECAKFSILFKGMVPEGACSDYWTPILMTELIQKK